MPCATSPGSGTAPVAVQANVAGLSTDTEYNFRLVASSNGGAVADTSAPASFTTTHADKPAVTIAAPFDVTGTTAKLRGTIDPLGNPASYRFEYQRVGDPGWTTVPGGSGSAGSGSGPVTKEAALAGLFTNTAYRVRLSATNGAGATLSAEEEFTTPPSPPVAVTMTAGQVSMSSAILRASINPAGEATTYYFEYGTSTAYGSRVPVAADPSAGDGNLPVVVSHPLSGLQPGTVYHFRVVAENGTGVAEGDDQSFMTATTPASCANEALRERQGVQYLPDCRAFELVSPAQKYGNDVITPDTGSYNNGDFAPTAAAGGDAVAFTSHGPFADAKSHPVYSAYKAVRGADGWSTQNLMPYLDGSRYSSPAMGFEHFTPDLGSWFVLGARSPQLTAGAAEGAANSFVWDGREYRLVSPGVTADDSGYAWFAGWSDDLSKVVLAANTSTGLTDDAPPGVEFLLYEWSAATGELALVGKKPGSDEPFDSAVWIANNNSGNGAPAWNGTRSPATARRSTSTPRGCPTNSSTCGSTAARRSTSPHRRRPLPIPTASSRPSSTSPPRTARSPSSPLPRS